MHGTVQRDYFDCNLDRQHPDADYHDSCTTYKEINRPASPKAKRFYFSIKSAAEAATVVRVCLAVYEYIIPRIGCFVKQEPANFYSTGIDIPRRICDNNHKAKAPQ